MYDCDWQKMFKTDNTVKQHLSESVFPTKCLSKKKDFWKISNLDVYLFTFNVIFKYPRNLPSIFKNSNVGRDNIGPFLNYYAGKEELLTQPREMLISS